MSVTREEVRRIADLARLHFSDDEEEQMTDELDDIVSYELDTSGVPPMSHVLDVTDVDRPDEVEARIDREQALENAPDADGSYFRVPRVIE